jgi:hypothetical protein
VATKADRSDRKVFHSDRLGHALAKHRSSAADSLVHRGLRQRTARAAPATETRTKDHAIATTIRATTILAMIIRATNDSRDVTRQKRSLGEVCALFNDRFISWSDYSGT